MQQWDALHAMLIYEILDLRESIRDEPEGWKHNPRVQGLRSPFLLKVSASLPFFSPLHFCLDRLLRGYQTHVRLRR